MKTLRTKEAVKILQDIFKLDISKQEKADKVREFVKEYGMNVLEDVCNKHFETAFPDWFEDFVVTEWKYPVVEPKDWRDKANSAWMRSKE